MQARSILPLDVAIDHRVRAFLKKLNSAGGKPMEEMSPDEARAGADEPAELGRARAAAGQGLAADDHARTARGRPDGRSAGRRRPDRAGLHVLPRRRLGAGRFSDARAAGARSGGRSRAPRPCS